MMQKTNIQCLIHGGLNKAGSSYLQSVMHQNRAELVRKGISYSGGGPGSGNATPMVLDLRAGRMRNVEDWLDRFISNAREAGADRLLLSSESLYHDLVVPDHRLRFVDALKSRGLKAPKLLLIFREPVAHAISAFCHRAGKVHGKCFSDWLRDGYEFPKELPAFLEMYDNEEFFELTLKRYTAHGMMEEFSNWLGVKPLPELQSRQVNVSPTLAEAEILIRMHRADRGMSESLRLAFKEIRKEDKASDTDLKSFYEQIARAELKKLNPHLNRLSSLVGGDFSVQAIPCKPKPDGQIAFSPSQIEAIVSAMTYQKGLIRSSLAKTQRLLERGKKKATKATRFFSRN